jgi:hypothetical protein
MLTDNTCAYNTVAQSAYRLRNIHWKYDNDDGEEGKKQRIIFLHTEAKTNVELVQCFQDKQKLEDIDNGKYLKNCLDKVNKNHLDDFVCQDVPVDVLDVTTYIQDICENLQLHAHRERDRERETEREEERERQAERAAPIDMHYPFVYQLNGSETKIHISAYVLKRLQNTIENHVTDNTLLLFLRSENTYYFFPLHQYYNCTSDFEPVGYHLEEFVYRENKPTSVIENILAFLFFSGFINDIFNYSVCIQHTIDYGLIEEDVKRLKHELERKGILHCFENINTVQEMLQRR